MSAQNKECSGEPLVQGPGFQTRNMGQKHLLSQLLEHMENMFGN